MSQSGQVTTAASNTTLLPQVIRGPEVDFTALSFVPIFTFTGDFIVTNIRLICTAVTGVSAGDGNYSIGFTGPDYRDIGQFAAGDYPSTLNYVDGPPIQDEYAVIPTGTTLYILIHNIDTGCSVLTERVDIEGYYY